MIPSDSAPRNFWKTIAAYVLMIAGAVVLFLLIRVYGEGLQAPPLPAESRDVPATKPPAAHWLFHLLLALAAVIALGRVLARVFAYLGQPPVIGEVVAGIALGPSLLGRLAPDVGKFVLPPEVAPSLAVVAQLGVVIYMFVVGLELNSRILRKQPHVTVAISHASIIVPFSLGTVLAVWLYPLLSHDGVSFTAFALFLSISLSITAFPVLARILTDRKLHKTELGIMALACAATDDVTAWCLLALVVGVVQSQVGQAALVALLTLGYILVMFLVARPILARFVPRWSHGQAQGVVLLGMLLSAMATEAIGIHAIFGAFMFGAVIPHDSQLALGLIDKLKELTISLLLPAFFAFTGMRTQIDLVTGLDAWLVCLVIIAVATLGKLGGTLAAARWMGLPWRESTSLGILMNTRGLMELIVLNIGLDLGVISPSLFAMMVLMALVTTIATSPLLAVCLPEVWKRAHATSEEKVATAS